MNVLLNRINFSGNHLKAGDGGSGGGGGGLATGAGLAIVNGDVTIKNSVFQDLKVTGGIGGNNNNGWLS